MKKGKLTIALLSSLALITSCSKVQVSLLDPDQAIVVDQSGAVVNVENNRIQAIFDTIQTGTYLTTAVRAMLTEGISEAYLGSYQVDEDGMVYIEGVDLSSDSSVFSFIQEHEFYWNWVSTGTRVVKEEEPSLSNISDYRTRLEQYIELVQKNVVKTLYDEAVVSSYMTNNRFYESLYARNLYRQLYSIYDANGNKVNGELLYQTPDYRDEENRAEFENAGYTFGKLVTRDYDPDKDYRMIIEGETQLLHLYHYVDYINIQIIPTIMSNLLTQSYVYSEQYQSIGRTQSRHLNFIKIDDNDDAKAQQLVREYVDTVLRYETESNVSYEALIEAWIGDHNRLNSDSSPLDNETKETARRLAESVFGSEVTTIESDYATYIDGKTGADYPYYKGSLYGDIIEDYSYLTNNPLTNDTDLYNSFISIDGLTYTPEEGLAKRSENLGVDSYVTNEWGSSSSFNLGDSSIVSKLFSYGLSSEFEIAHNENTSYLVDGYYLKQFQIGGPTFLKKETYSNEIDSIIWSYEGSYYIIEVVDQVSLDKLSLSEDSTSEERETIEQYAQEIGYTVARASTYTDDALLYYLEKSNINYYDEDVYDYFETNFPDLFD